MEPESSQWYPVRGPEAVAQVEKRGILFKYKKKLSIKVVKQWKRLPRDCRVTFLEDTQNPCENSLFTLL